MDKIEIGKFIQTERKKQSISQQALADRLKSTRQTIICMEKGTANFNIDLFLLILDTLGVRFELKTPDNTISVDVETQGVDGKLVVTKSDEPNTILMYDFRQVLSAVPEDEPEPVIVSPPKKQRSSKSSKTFW